MAKAALEMAVLDAELRTRRRLARRPPRRHRDLDPLRRVGGHPAVDRRAGRRRRRLPGRWLPAHQTEDRAGLRRGCAVRAVREHIGPDVPLQVDANTAYTVADADHLAGLDELDLLLIEQPSRKTTWPATSSWQTARTPVCLDEKHPLGRRRGRRHRPGRLLGREHQGRPGRRLPGGGAGPRRLPRPGRAGLVRRHGRDRARAGGQRRAGRAARLHPAGRHLELRPLLHHRPHRAAGAARRRPRRPHRPRPRRDPLPDRLEEFTVHTGGSDPHDPGHCPYWLPISVPGHRNRGARRDGEAGRRRERGRGAGARQRRGAGGRRPLRRHLGDAERRSPLPAEVLVALADSGNYVVGRSQTRPTATASRQRRRRLSVRDGRHLVPALARGRRPPGSPGAAASALR